MDVQEYLPQATAATEIILDCEVLLVSAATGVPLPFGTFNKHKKGNFAEAYPCLFVFDILSLEGETLIGRPMDERRAILESNLKVSKSFAFGFVLFDYGSSQVIPNRIRLSEQYRPKDEAELKVLMTTIMGKKLEGVVIKLRLSWLQLWRLADCFQ